MFLQLFTLWIYRCRPKINVTNARNCLFMFKINQQIEKNSLKRNFYGIMNQCKHKHATSLVYIIKNWELCILLITLELTLKFWLIVRNDLRKHYKNYKNQKNHIWPKSWASPFNSWNKMCNKVFTFSIQKCMSQRFSCCFSLNNFQREEFYVMFWIRAIEQKNLKLFENKFYKNVMNWNHI